jgi:hypothetical protein
MLPISVIVMELPDPPEVELDEDPVVDEPAEVVPPEVEEFPPDELELLVPAETAEPTEIGSAVITPSMGALTTVSDRFLLAVS